MDKETLVLKTAEEYCRFLGIPIPEFRIEGATLGKKYKRLTRQHKNLGYCGGGFERHPGGYIAIRTFGRPPSEIKRTVAHELVHWTFPGIPHDSPSSQRFSEYVKALQSGNMIFDGRGLDTTKPKPPEESRVFKSLIEAQDRLALYRSKEKRYAGLVKKYVRRVKRLEEKARALNSPPLPPTPRQI
jgi:hypothetical protein